MMLQRTLTESLEQIFGRDREAAALNAVLENAVAGNGKLVLVSGEAGIGKTSLIEHVLLDTVSDVMILAAACRDLVVSPPFGIWTQLFDSYQRLTGTGSRTRVPSALVTGADLEHAGARSELFADVLSFVTELAEHQLVVIVLEDLHWSDGASIELLHHLAISIEHLSVVIVGSYRDTEVTSGIPLYRRLPGLVRDTRAIRIELRQVDAEAIGALVASRYSMDSARAQQQLATWLYRHGEGIPFFTVELLFNLQADGKLRRQGDRWTLHELGSVQVPLLVRQFVDQRLERLAPEQVQILQLAAVIGDEVPLDLWTTLADVDDLDLIDVIEASQQIGILQELPTADGYRFSHALFRTTLYNQLILPRRRTWHARVGELLADGPGADPDVVAHHFRLAGDTRAGRWLIAAGRQAIKSFAYEMASERFEQALSVLGESELPTPEQGWLLCDLAMTFRFADATRGLRYLDRASQLAADSGDDALELYCHWCSAQIRSLRGDNALEELDTITDALDETGACAGTQGALTVLSGGSIAQTYARYGLYQRASDQARRYLDHHPGEISEAASRAYSAIALAAAGMGDPIIARQAFSQGRAVASQLRDPHLTGMLLNWELMEVVLPYDADQREARKQLATDALAAWDRVEMPGSRGASGDDDSRPSTDMSVYATLLLDGDWDSAEEQAKIDLEFDGMRFDALRVLAILALRRGNLADAQRYLQQALPQGPSTEPSNYYYFSALWLQRTGAELALATGDVTLAMRWVDTHDAWLEWSGRLLNRAESRLLRGRIHEAGGDFALAERYAGEALELASQPRQPLALIQVQRNLGHLALVADDLDSATEHLDQALALAQACAAPYEIAMVQLERVDLLRKRLLRDEVELAAEDVRRAAERLGARPLLDRLAHIEAEEAAAPVPEEVPGGLSPRELEVLLLVARGMTDVEVGEALFISPRTVGRHLRSVYNKLGVNSRTAASAFAFQHGLIAEH